MISLFMVLWAAYTVHALYYNLAEERRGSLLPHLLQSVLIILACIWCWRQGVFNRLLWSPIVIVSGLALGHVLFAISLAITHQHMKDVLLHAADLRGMCGFFKESPELLFRFAGVAIAEELVYRGAAQEMLGTFLDYPWEAVPVTAVAFCVLHQHFFRNGFVCAVEFFLFSLTIGALYFFTQSLTLAILAHLIRNLESAYLEYHILLDEDKSEDEALHLLNRRYGSPKTELT